MFGMLRTALALVVVCAHLLGSIGYSAAYAVFGFYVLSGFLMARILDDKYGYSFRGSIFYLTNRFLRLYPIYWLGCALSLLLLILVGEDVARAFHRTFLWPDSTARLFGNLANWYFRPDDSSRLVPPSWAIGVEFVYYIAIGFGIGKTRIRALVWLAVSIGYHIAAFQIGWDRYYGILAASLPFAIGVTLFNFRAYFPTNSWVLWTSAISLVFIVFGTPRIAWLDPRALPFYAALVVAAVLISQLANLSGGSLGNRVDNWIGGLSYPIYVFHYQVGLIVHVLTGTSRYTWPLFAIAVPTLTVLSAAVAALAARTVDRARARIREMATLKREAAIPTVLARRAMSPLRDLRTGAFTRDG